MARKKPVKNMPSPWRLIFIAIFMLIAQIAKGSGRLLVWLIMTAGIQSRKKPLAAVGLCAFFMTFAFVGVNALFQPTRFFEANKLVRPAIKPNPQLMSTQRQLAEMGLYDGEIDGFTGPKTQEALENWQKLRHALEEGKRASPIRKQDEDELAKIIRETKE